MYPTPTVDEPDMETYLYESMFGTDGSESTDGCPIEPDGTCEHGYPSWEKQWGII